VLALLMMGVPLAISSSQGGFMRDFRGPGWAGAMMLAGVGLWLVNKLVWKLQRSGEPH
jgi:hypothetical protein